MPRPAVRAVVSLLVALHVLAVFVGPWAMPPSSTLAADSRRIFQPYLDVLSLGNGYRFFAPEPGPSHLVRYEVTLADGTLKTGEFPNRQVNWPRLLYHRYFMLSEFVNTLGSPDAANELAEAFAKGYAQHLANEYDGRTVRALFAPPLRAAQRARCARACDLTDKSLYEERLLAVYTRDES